MKKKRLMGVLYRGHYYPAHGIYYAIAEEPGIGYVLYVRKLIPGMGYAEAPIDILPGEGIYKEG